MAPWRATRSNSFPLHPGSTPCTMRWSSRSAARTEAGAAVAVSRARRRQTLRHSIARGHAEFAGGRTILDVAVGAVEAIRGFGALETALSGAALYRPRFEGSQERSARAAKPRVGRDVVEEDLAPVGHHADRDDRAAVDSHQQGGVGPRDPD